MGNREAEKQSADARNVAPGLAELRKRVEAATGPDRELDVLVAVAVGWKPHPTGWVDPGGIIRAVSPFFTRSLDAVLALVGEKLPGWHVNELHQRPDEPLWWADLLVREIEGPPGDEATWRANAHAATPALALLSALLAALDAGAPASAKNEDAA